MEESSAVNRVDAGPNPAGRAICVCGNPAQKKYCSRSCAASVNNKIKPKRSPEGLCLDCKVPIKTIFKRCEDCKKKYKVQRKEYGKKQTSKFVAVHRRRLKLRIVEYLGGKCSRCGYDKCRAALNAHHKDPSTKSFGLSAKGITRSWETVKAEADKCILLCANCHMEEHWL